MSLHSLLSVTVGVPNVDETAACYDQLWTPEDLEGARGPVRLGPAAAPLLPASRGPRGHDDRSPLDPLNGAR